MEIDKKDFPPKERPDWCELHPLSWEELLASTDIPVWLEIKGMEHLNQWALVSIDLFTRKVIIFTPKFMFEVEGKYGEGNQFVAYSPRPQRNAK